MKPINFDYELIETDEPIEYAHEDPYDDDYL